MSRVVPTRIFARYLGILISLFFCSNSVFGAEQVLVPEPSGPVILEITGNIESKNFDQGMRFDYDMLAELGLVEYKVETPWTKGSVLFSGILTRSLMSYVGAAGKEIFARAIDGYTITIPLSDFSDHDTLLALQLDGERMRVRNKGPAWVIYHPDDRPQIPETLNNSRMIWQLKSLEIR